MLNFFGGNNMAKKEVRKMQLLTIALDEFITKGFYGTSTREIAGKAQISSGLLFHYFDSKESLYQELVETGLSKMHLDVSKANENPKLYLEHMVQSILEQLETNRFFAKMFVLIDAAQHTVGIPEGIRNLLQSQNMFVQCRQIIECGQQKGQFRSGNSQALCVAFLGAIQGIAQEKVRVEDTPLPKKEWIIDIILNSNGDE
jgi:AcrR family transcriptional regulator